MSRLDNTQQQIEKIRTLGMNNKKLIPHVRNWCKHIVVEPHASGIVAIEYNIPNSVSISCPHFENGGYGANLEWIATDFIVECCRNCDYHQEVFEKNFGVEVILKFNQKESIKKKRQTEYIQIKDDLEKEIEDLISKGEGEIAQLSILRLIHSLFNNEDTENTPERILEASKISPNYFDKTSLDYLAIFFENKEFGNTLLNATINVLNNGLDLSDFAFDRLVSTIKSHKNIDSASGVLCIVIKKRKFKKHHNLIEHVIDALWYKRNIGEPHDIKRSYPNSIELLINMHHDSSKMFHEIIKQRLEINEKIQRININYLIQEIIEIDYKLILPHTEMIIKSLEYFDDVYEESADWATCLTIIKLLKKKPKLIFDKIMNSFENLSLGAQIEMIKLFQFILTEIDVDEILDENKKSKLVNRIFNIFLSVNVAPVLLEKTLKTTNYLAREKPELIFDRLDIMLGVITKMVQDYKSFLFYKEELDKPLMLRTTFNPLPGMMPIEIINLEQTKLANIRSVEEIIEYIVKYDNDRLYLQLVSILDNLKSDEDELLKCHLIKITRNSLVSPLIISNLLPEIYNYVLDPASKAVRIEGLEYIIHLIDKYSNLVTQTFIDIVKVLLYDSDVGIQGMALDVFGSLIKKFPQHIEFEQLEHIIDLLSNKYVYIHKRASKLAFKIYSFLSENQKTKLLFGIIALEEYYFMKKEYEYCKDLVNILLFITRETQKTFNIIVENHIVKYCKVEDNYIVLHFLDKLTQLRNEFPQFNEIWLEVILDYMSRPDPTVRDSMYENKFEYYDTFFELSQNLINKKIDKTHALVKDKIQHKSFHHVYNIFFVFAYFNMHENIIELSEYFFSVISDNKSNKYAYNNISDFFKVSKLESDISKGNVNADFIKSLNTNDKKTKS